VGIDESTYTVIVAAETVISRRFEALEEDEYAEEAEHAGKHISREELQAKADDLASGIRTYVLMTVISAVIATAGLLLNSPATVVGSMVIAPLIGPAMSAAVGTVVDDEEMFRRGVRMQVLGVAVAIAAATLFAFALRWLALVPPGLDPLDLAEVSERLAPNVLVLVVAIGAGLAGIISLMTGRLRGAGGRDDRGGAHSAGGRRRYRDRLSDPRLVIGAGVIVAVNVLSINLSALVTLWYEGIARSAGSARTTRARLPEARGHPRRCHRGAVGVPRRRHLRLMRRLDDRGGHPDRRRRRAGRDKPGMELIELEVDRGGTLPPRNTERVVVTVGAPPDVGAETVARALDQRIESAIGEDVQVEVRLVAVSRA